MSKVMELSRRRVLLAIASITALGSQTVMAQGQASVPLWQQTVCMSVVTAFGLLAAPPEMLIDLAKERVGRGEKADG